MASSLYKQFPANGGGEGADQRKPIVSLCVSAYNVRDYICEALDGVFAQTYRPLEIVVSDDCSTDGTTSIIHEYVQRKIQQGLPQDLSVRVLMNERNMGNMRNWERLVAEARGELLVKADGDDISFPCRVEKLVNAWVAGGKKASLVVSDAFCMDKTGKHSLGFVRMGNRRGQDLALGAVSAYARWALDVFDPCEDGDAFDDQVYTSRMLLIGDAICVPEDLVAYRIGSGLSSSRSADYRGPVTRVTLRKLAATRQLEADIRTLKGNGYSLKNGIDGSVLYDSKVLPIMLGIQLGASVRERFKSYRELIRVHNGRFLHKRLWLLLALPRMVGDPILNVWQLVKQFRVRFANRHLNVADYLHERFLL